ncbi:MAG: hypothetical protein H7210_04140 [Pyrinomonadaceae bacterium]|nr:hypothetical protein [Phycisphaerales bacterium]
MKLTSRLNRLEQQRRLTATCRIGNGKGRWVAEYEDDCYAPPKPTDHAYGCRGCGKQNVISVAHVEMQSLNARH